MTVQERKKRKKYAFLPWSEKVYRIEFCGVCVCACVRTHQRMRWFVCVRVRVRVRVPVISNTA